MAACPRICRYIHAPAQSGSDRILKLMNRGYTRGEYLEFIARVTEKLPDCTIAGDIIVGFPTETDADFELTASLVRAVPFKNNFIFKYSPRPGTVAIDRFEDDVPNEVKRLRNNLLLDIQTEVSARVHAAWVGKRVEVLVEDIRDDSDESVAAPPQGSSPPLVADAASPARKATSMSLPLAGRSSDAPAQPSPLRASRSTSTRPARQAIGRTRGDLIVSIPLERGATAPGRGSILEVDILRSAPLILEGCVVKTAMAASEGRL
jgi:tRNA-2-methylthio-N6-dimethylallyladenosine synthase